jgi:hypothetical protein
VPPYEYIPMEYRMLNIAKQSEKDCLGFGQYLYGKQGEGPFILHLDGRNTLER